MIRVFEKLPSARWVPLVALGSMALVVLGSVIAPPSKPLPDDVPAWVGAFVRWDAGWYGEIARNGYWVSPGQQSPVAFFPMFPLGMRALTWLGLNRWVAGVLVSLGCGLAALALFRRWAERIAPEAAPTALWLVCLYPFAEYLYGIIYSDGMFLLFAVGAFLLLETEHPVGAAVLGACAAACRPVAPALVAGLLVRSIERRRRAGQPVRVVDWVPALSGLGLVAYMAFLGWRFDDPLAFVHVQAAPGWAQPPGWESWFKLEFFKLVFTARDPLVPLRLGTHALCTFGALALGVATVRRLGWGYAVYALVAVGIPAVSSKDFQGLGRYVIAAFPLFVTAALLLADKPRARRVAFAVSALGLAICAYALGTGGYVA